MTTVVVSINTRAPTPPEPPQPPARVVGFRVLHACEGGRVPDPPGSPQVVPPYSPTVKLEMTRDIQLMSYDLMAHFNAVVRADRGRWRNVHGSSVAMNNGTGFDEEGDPRRDYVTRYPNVVDANAPNPFYDKMQRTFGGSFVTGAIQGNVIWCEPGRDAIDGRGFHYEPGTPEAAATLAEIISKRWYSYATAMSKYTGLPYRMRDHWHPTDFVVFPFVLDRPVSYDARFFVAWDETYAPEPLKVYL